MRRWRGKGAGWSGAGGGGGESSLGVGQSNPKTPRRPGTIEASERFKYQDNVPLNYSFREGGVHSFFHCKYQLYQTYFKLY